MAATRGGSWGNPRTTTAAWRRLRVIVLDRDHGICHVCQQPDANEVDHVNGRHDDDRLDNLAAIHAYPCHARKSSAEGHAAKARNAALTRRPAEAHPGVINR